VQLSGMCLVILFVNAASVYAQTVPDVRGVWTGSGTSTWNNCNDPGDNGTYNGNVSVTITSQAGASFSGTSLTTFSGVGFVFIETSNFSGTVTPAGNFTASGTYSSTWNGSFDASGTQTNNGAVTGNTITSSGTFTDTVGDTCTGTNFFTVSRSGPIPPPINIGVPTPPPSCSASTGMADLVWRNLSTGDVASWDLTGLDLTSSGIISCGVPLEWKIVGIGDLDNNGTRDLVWRNTTTGDVAVWLMTAVGVASMEVLASGLPLDWQIAGIGDLDGNGTADVVWRHVPSGLVAAWYMTSGTGLVDHSEVLATIPANWVIGGVGDLDNNGTADVLWRHPTTGTVAAWYMTLGTGAVDHSAVLATGLPGDWIIAGIGDLDGNGTADVVWRHVPSGLVAAWLMTAGTGAVGSSDVIATIPADWIIGAIGDLNNNGTADVVWHHPSSGTVAGWLMNGLNVASSDVIVGGVPLNWKIAPIKPSLPTPPSLLVTVNKIGAGTGTVISTPAGINCGPTCSASFTQGTSLTLTATSATGSTFSGWSGGGCTGTAACTITLNQAINVSALFTVADADISGVWFARETVTATCSLLGEEETFDLGGNAFVTINQNGQQVSYIPPGGTSDLIRTGLVTGNSVQFSGKFIIPVEGVDIIFTQNVATSNGTVSGNSMHLTGVGVARGTVVGIGELQCTGNSTATFTR